MAGVIPDATNEEITLMNAMFESATVATVDRVVFKRVTCRPVSHTPLLHARTPPPQFRVGPDPVQQRTCRGNLCTRRANNCASLE